MSTKTTHVILLSLILVSIIAGIIAFPLLPERIASHWNAQGIADGTMSKFWGIFLFPLIVIVFYLFFLLIPKIEPQKTNLESFRIHFNRFWVLLSCFFLYIYALSLLWNSGFRFNFTSLIVPAISVLFYFIGSLLTHAKRNYFVGIRTPWTLSNDTVWGKTHTVGGKLFKLAAILSLFGLAFSNSSFSLFFILVPIVRAVHP